ncbi:alpha-L-arabinofuranosidase [Agriterribacter sp.]|uniref:alpha-L-arabinofuranosidase n=1 Tax=Agriterribacter sp. TaxID=2821509 RepID=UPI002B5BB2F4|nr:alpha-L-arabinofuranosidase [Agriterribacter sp.]HRP56327.1 alpha-L-arabinofuranosidase [Agriterribacter sp.]
MPLNKKPGWIAVLSVLFCIALLSCKKTKTPAPDPVPSTDTPVVVQPVTDPPVAATMGFFADDWQAKTFAAPAYTEATPVTAATSNTVTVDASSIITKIPLSLFGHNANTWMTPMVTEPLFMEHITNLHPHIIRWPAGSGSDVYFWNQPEGAVPPDAPQQIMDKDGILKEPGYWYGRSNNNWSASLDNYYAMLQQSGNRGMITVNYGYARYGTSDDPVAAAAHLAADWVRYDNGRTQYWEIGNENYGDWEWGYRIDLSANKDGQPEYITGKLYAQHFKVFIDSMQKAAAEIGKKIYIGATLVESPSEAWQTNTVKTWNSSMLPELDDKHDFYVVHNYFTPYNSNSNAAVVLNAAYTVPAQMMDFISQTLQTAGAPVKPVALTEWNMWAGGSKQQVSNTSGVFALLVVGEALKNKYGMAARWDLLNGWSNGDDHGLFSDGNEPGIPKWTPRPSFYYMYFFQKMLGDRLIPVSVKNTAAIVPYASTYSSGQVNLTLINTSASPVTAEVKINNFNPGNRFYWYSLEGSNDNGEFSRKVLVNGSGPELEAGGPSDYTTLKAYSATTLNGIKIIVPPLGAVCMVIDKNKK